MMFTNEQVCDYVGGRETMNCLSVCKIFEDTIWIDFDGLLMIGSALMVGSRGVQMDWLDLGYDKTVRWPARSVGQYKSQKEWKIM